MLTLITMDFDVSLSQRGGKETNRLSKLHLLFAIFLSFLSILHAQSNHYSFQYISPKPAAKLVSKETNIIIRPSEVLTKYNANIASLFKVEGSVSGIHTGDVIISDDQKTIIFNPHRTFEPGESVSVSIDRRLNAQNGDESDAFSFRFDISPKRDKLRQDLLIYEQEGYNSVQTDKNVNVTANHDLKNNDFSLPVDFPSITVTEFDNPDSGYVFLSNFSFSTPTITYLIILDNTGFPIFFRKMPAAVVDFKKQPNGLLTYYLVGPNRFYAMDNSYTVVDSFQTGNGYSTDGHELQILPNGHALLMSYDPQIVDMSQIVLGGDTAATVIGLIIQEIDQSKNVVFQWRSWDHFQITDATNIDVTSSRIDYAHGNAIELDFDGNLLISSRHMDEITKIDRQTGEFIWRLGGKNNQFTFTNDRIGFSYQHDIRRLANGNITLFDNGNFHNPQFSRAVEYQIDEQSLTATLVWQYRNMPDIYGGCMGTTQRLPNGNTLIGWGCANPTLTEVRPDGSKAFELTLDPNIFTYRAFRFPWNGVAIAPYLWADTSSQELTLNFVRFGATNVVRYYIYQGTSPSPTTRVDSTTSNSIVISGLTNGITYYFRVTSLDDQLNESPFSNELEFTATVTGIGISDSQIPEEYILFQNYPNPFNITTTVRYALKENTKVTLKIYNVLGQKVRTLVNENQSAGFKSAIWDGKNNFGNSVSTGIYILTLRVNNEIFNKKMLLLK